MKTLPVPLGSSLPPLLHDVAAIGGDDAVARLTGQFGGRTVYVPKRPTPALVRRLGIVLAAWLSARFGGGKLTVPMGPNTRTSHLVQAIRTMVADAKSTATIARTLGVSTRTVQRHRARLRKA